MKYLSALLLACNSLFGQAVIDSFSPSGVINTPTFSFPITTSALANRGLLAAVDIRTGPGAPVPVTTTSVKVGSVSLVKLTGCADPQYGTPAIEKWGLPPGVQPATGQNFITVTFSSAPYFAAVGAYSLSNVNQATPFGPVGCNVVPNGSTTSLQANSVTIAAPAPHSLVIASIMIPNSTDPADMATWPGSQDANTNNYDVGFFSHVADTGAVSPTSYGWTWTKGREPSAAAVVAVNSASAIQPAPAGLGQPTWMQGPRSNRPTACPTVTGLTFYLMDDPGQPKYLTFCTPGNPWTTASTKPWDSWPVPFHDSQHTGVSADVMTPPLTLLWKWQNNHTFDLIVGRNSAVSLPIAYSDKICLQGNLNANRLICLHPDRTPAFESDNSGYTESGFPWVFLNYPALVGNRVIFGSVDYTTTVSAADGSGAMNIYNTLGIPGGGLIAWNGIGFQQFYETDDGSEDFYRYTNPALLDRTSSFHANYTGIPQTDPIVPAVDAGVAYAVVGGSLRAYDANTFGLLWTLPGLPGSSPAVANGIVYVGGLSLQAIKSGTVLWSKPISGFSPIVANGVIYLGASDANFYAVSMAGGATLWSFKTAAPFTPAQIPAISGQWIYVPGADGKLYTLRLSDGSLASSYAGVAAWGPVAIAHGLVYSSDSTGQVYAFQAASAAKGL